MKYAELEVGVQYITGSPGDYRLRNGSKHYSPSSVDNDDNLVTLVSLERYSGYKRYNARMGDVQNPKVDPKGPYVKVVMHNQVLSYPEHKTGEKEGYVPFTFIAVKADELRSRVRSNIQHEAARRKDNEARAERAAEAKKQAEFLAERFKEVGVEADTHGGNIVFDRATAERLLDMVLRES